jgi:hypothetical protein
MSFPTANEMKKVTQENMSNRLRFNYTESMHLILQSVKAAAQSGKNRTLVKLPSFMPAEDVNYLRKAFRKKGYRVSLQTHEGEVKDGLFWPPKTTIQLVW